MITQLCVKIRYTKRCAVPKLAVQSHFKKHFKHKAQTRNNWSMWSGSTTALCSKFYSTRDLPVSEKVLSGWIKLSRVKVCVVYYHQVACSRLACSYVSPTGEVRLSARLARGTISRRVGYLCSLAIIFVCITFLYHLFKFNKGIWCKVLVLFTFDFKLLIRYFTWQINDHWFVIFEIKSKAIEFGLL